MLSTKERISKLKLPSNPMMHDCIFGYKLGSLYRDITGYYVCSQCNWRIHKNLVIKYDKAIRNFVELSASVCNHEWGLYNICEKCSIKKSRWERDEKMIINLLLMKNPN